MAKFVHIALIVVCALSIVPVQAAVLVEDGGRPVNRSYVKTASDGLSLRSVRRVGLGLGLAGATGMAGAHLELNFAPDVSLIGGIGLSSEFRSFHVQLKKVVSGRSFLPYIAGGVARWYSTDAQDPIETTTPHFLGQRFLNATERASGEFSEILLYPALGIQYLQLTGEWAGLALNAEVLMLIDIDDFVAAPTGSLGMSYYF